MSELRPKTKGLALIGRSGVEVGWGVKREPMGKHPKESCSVPDKEEWPESKT